MRNFEDILADYARLDQEMQAHPEGRGCGIIGCAGEFWAAKILGGTRLPTQHTAADIRLPDGTESEVRTSKLRRTGGRHTSIGSAFSPGKIERVQSVVAVELGHDLRPRFLWLLKDRATIAKCLRKEGKAGGTFLMRPRMEQFGQCIFTGESTQERRTA